MNFKLTMTLIIVLTLLATGYLLLPEKKKAEENPSGVTPLLAGKPSDLKSITYSRDGSDELTFAKQGPDWVMTYPVKSAVEAYQVQSIADDLRTAGYKQKFEPESTGARTPEATGTGSPHNVIKFTDDTGKDHTLALGKRTVDGIYATLDGAKTIYLLDKDPLASLQQEPDKFRDKSIKKIDSANVTGLTVKTADNTVTLAKSGDKWLITAPIHARANAVTVDEMLRELSAINAVGFSRLTKQTASLVPPVLAVTAYVQDAPATAPAASQPSLAGTQPAGTPVTLELGVYTDILRKAAVYASLASSDQVFTLRADSFNKLNRDLKDLRDPAVTPAPVSQATDVTVTTQGQPPLAFARKDGGWALTAPAPLAADPAAVDNFLGLLRDLRAIKYVDNAGDLKSIGLDPPQARIELALPNQSQHEVLLIGKPETADKVTPVMRQGEPTVYLVQTADAERLAVSPRTLRDKTVEALAGDHIRGIAITGPSAAGGPGGVTLERDGGRWVVKANGKTEPADDVKVSALLADFTPLVASKYVDEKPAAGAPAVTVTLNLLEPSKPAAATAPGTAPALPPAEAIGPDLGRPALRTLRLVKADAAPAGDAAAGWKATWESQSPAWSFEPHAALIDHVTKTDYAATPATQPATVPAPAGQ